jgi:hypothetical protein
MAWIGIAALTHSGQETVTGAVDGTNRVFTLTSSPNPSGGLVLVRSGLTQHVGIDYAISGSTVTFLLAATPQAGDVLLAWYRY